MKELFNFIRWQWRKYELWQKWWIVGAGFFGAGITSSKDYSHYFFAVPVSIIFFYTFKWWIWEPAKESWREYKQEKQNLFETIKTSHER